TGHPDLPRAQKPGELSGVEYRLGRDVEGAARVSGDCKAIGVADIARVDGLEAQARRVGHERHEPGPHERAREEWPREQAPDPRRRLALEDQPRPTPEDPRTRAD